MLQVILAGIAQFKSLFIDILDVGGSSVGLFGLSTFSPSCLLPGSWPSKSKASCALLLRLPLLICVSISILLTCLKALGETLLVLNGGAEPETMLKLNYADTTSPCSPAINDETPKL